MAKNFRETLSEELKDYAFKAEYDALEIEFQVIRAMLAEKDERNLIQNHLSEFAGTD